MKHTHIYTGFFAAIMMLLSVATGCMKKDLYDPSVNGPKIIASIDEAVEDTCSTRMVVSMGETSPTGGNLALLWETTDEIGVFTNAAENNIRFRNTANENVKIATFTSTSAISGTPTYAYYPYSAETGADMEAIKGQIPSTQTISTELDNVPGVYRYGYYKSTSGNSSSFGFKHVFSIVRFHLDVTGTKLAGRKIRDIQISVKRGTKVIPICGDFTFNAATGEHKIGSNTSNAITVSFEGQPVLDNEITFYTTLFSSIKKNDVLYFTVNAAGYTATYKLSSKVTFSKNNLYTYSMAISSYSSLKVVENEIGKPDPSELPTFSGFSFNVSQNTGKLLNNELKWNSSKHTPSFSSLGAYNASVDNDANEVKLTIPYLYDFKLIPSFTTNSSCTVTVNGVEQKSGTTEVDFSAPVTYTVTDKSTGFSRDYKVSITNTGLPIVVINQSGSGDFGKKYNGGVNIGSMNIGGTLVNQFVDFMIRGKDTDWVTDDQIKVYNPDGSLDCEVAGGARLRGNTTQVYPKKPFALKFNEKKSVLGLPAHKRWVLLANWLDHSMIRNSVAFNMAMLVEYAWRDSGGAIEPGVPWNVHGQNVELVIDGHHVGNYYLCEQIKVDKNRLNLTSGYLFEVDGNYDEEYKFKTSKQVPFMFKDDADDATVNSVKSVVQGIETNIYNGNFAAAYADLDINSVIDQWLVLELAMNREYGDPRSVYMFMNDEGKLCGGPVWDFDRGTFQNQERATDMGNSASYRVKPDNEWLCWRTQENETYSYIWFKQLIKDKTFQETVQKRWAYIKPYLELMPDQIRYYGETLALSYKYNSAMWPVNSGDVTKYKSDFKDWSGDEELGQNGNYQEVIDNFLTVYDERLSGVNTLITTGKFTK